MIEKDNILNGQSVETSSSDSFIEKRISVIRQELYGLSDQVIEAGVEIYAPLPINDRTDPVSDAVSAKTTDKPNNGTHKESAYGLHILNLRKVKKAA